MAAGEGVSYHIVRISHKHHKIILRQIYWARYVDWSITTPLLLLDLTVLAGLPGMDILLAIFADVVMVLFVTTPTTVRLSSDAKGIICSVFSSQDSVGLLRHCLLVLLVHPIHAGYIRAASSDCPWRSSRSTFHVHRHLYHHYLDIVSRRLGSRCGDSKNHSRHGDFSIRSGKYLEVRPKGSNGT